MTAPRPVSPNDPAEWDAWAATYAADVDCLESVHDGDLAELLAPAGKRVLDAGCGTGRRAKNALAGAASVLAVDISEGMAHEARLELAGMPGAAVLCLDLEKEPLPEGAVFDAAMAVSVLHHIAAPDRFLGAIAGALRPGGRFVAVDFVSGRPLPALLGYYAEMFFKRNPLRLAAAFVKGYVGNGHLARHKKREAMLTLEDFRARYERLLPGCRVEVRHGIFAYLVWDKP